MKFLIDGHKDRVLHRMQQWPEGVAGQLLTPLTRYSRGFETFAIDNGAYSGFNEKAFIALLNREYLVKDQCSFVCVPDIVGSHEDTLTAYYILEDLCEGYPKAFVAQDGYEGMPDSASALFIGGTNHFKDSDDALSAVRDAIFKNKHVHVGRVNNYERFNKFHNEGAHTCDGSGISRYDHMIETLRDKFNANRT